MNTDRYQNRVRFRHHWFMRGPLLLTRTPKFLRFVYREHTNNAMTWEWDALDQPDDAPSADEGIIVGVLSSATVAHIDRVDPKTRRKIGEWVRLVDYTPHPNPPPDDVLRDNVKWQAWCLAQVEVSEAKGASDESDRRIEKTDPGRND